MYTEFFGMTKKPFSIAPDPAFMFQSKHHKRAQNMLEYGVMSHAGFTVITGPIGAGKTTLIRNLLSEMGDDVVTGHINNTHQSFGNLMLWILDAFDVPCEEQDNAKRFRQFSNFVLNQYAEQKRVLLVVDEAQNLSIDTLEELRLISNINTANDIFLQLILVGQSELIEKLNRPELTQFAQRIGVDYNLLPMSRKDTERYILHRLTIAGRSDEIFSDAAMAAVYCFSEGIPRRINLLCDMALVYAFADDKQTVNAEIIIDVVKDRNVSPVIQRNSAHTKELDEVSDWLEKNEKIDVRNLLFSNDVV